MTTGLTMAIMEGIAFRGKDSARTAMTALGKIRLDWEQFRNTRKGKLVLEHLALVETSLKLLSAELHEFAMDLELGKRPIFEPEQKGGKQ